MLASPEGSGNQVFRQQFLRRYYFSRRLCLHVTVLLVATKNGSGSFGETLASIMAITREGVVYRTIALHIHGSQK